MDAPASPKTLRLAPQLGVLAVLDEALLVACCALVATHPRLAAVQADSDPPDESAARRLHDCLRHCSHVLADYRIAVADMLGDLDDASFPADPDSISF
jgi:hypothetical protein